MWVFKIVPGIVFVSCFPGRDMQISRSVGTNVSGNDSSSMGPNEEGVGDGGEVGSGVLVHSIEQFRT